jgi:hypothetical protein
VAVKAVCREGAALAEYGLEPPIEAQGKNFAVRGNQPMDLLDSYMQHSAVGRCGMGG